MKCRQCGTEIAEKALICYRCGTATTEAKYAPVPIGSSSSAGTPGLALIIVLVILVFLGAYLGETGTADSTRLTGWSVAAVAAILLAVRTLRRRRR